MSILASSLALGAADHEWRDRALCRDTDPELFFPVGTTGTALTQIDRAKQVCGECTARGRVPRVRARHQPGLRHLGWAVRGGAPRHPPPARRRRPAPQRRLTVPRLDRYGSPYRIFVRTGFQRRHHELDDGAVVAGTDRARRVVEAGVARSSALAGRIVIVPLSSVVTSVRTIDRPSPVAARARTPGSSPLPSSMTSMLSSSPSLLQRRPRPCRRRCPRGTRGRRRSASAR